MTERYTHTASGGASARMADHARTLLKGIPCGFCGAPLNGDVAQVNAADERLSHRRCQRAMRLRTSWRAATPGTYRERILRERLRDEIAALQAGRRG